jgi:hypothetical protein
MLVSTAIIYQYKWVDFSFCVHAKHDVIRVGSFWKSPWTIDSVNPQKSLFRFSGEDRIAHNDFYETSWKNGSMRFLQVEKFSGLPTTSEMKVWLMPSCKPLAGESTYVLSWRGTLAPDK